MNMKNIPEIRLKGFEGEWVKKIMENRVICKSPWIKVDMVALFLPQDVAQL